MRISKEKIKDMQFIMKNRFGMDISDEQAQEIGLAIIAMLIAKARRDPQLIKSLENKYES